jgi:hypothetical protein
MVSLEHVQNEKQARSASPPLRKDPRSASPPRKDPRSASPPRKDPKSASQPRKDPRSADPPKKDPRSADPPKRDLVEGVISGVSRILSAFTMRKKQQKNSCYA